MSFVRETPVTTGSTALDSLATVLIIAPLTCVEDLHFLSKTSALGIVIIFISFGVIFAYGLIQHGLSGIWDVTWDDMWPNSLTGACNWFGVTVFGFGAVPITFNLMESMRNPRGMSEATKIALWIVGCTYLTVGNGIGILFKPSVPEFKGDVLQELPETLWIPTMIRIAMSLVLTFTAPILLVPCAEIIEGKLGMIDLEHKPHYRILIRFGICFFCASVALIVPSFVHIISFIGAFCVVLTSFVFPPLLHLQLLRKKMSETEGIRLFKRSDKELGRFGTIQDKNKQFWRRTAHIDAALLLLGIILSLLASAVTFIDLMRQIRLYREDDDGDGE
jgi:amino acid permease